MDILLTSLLLGSAIFVGYFVLRNYLFQSKKPDKPDETIPHVAVIQGPGKFAFEVVGESYYQKALRAICGKKLPEGHEKYIEAFLIHEDDNPYDPQAIRVDIMGRTVGYLPRAMAREFRGKMLEAGHPGRPAKCQALINGGWNRGKGETGHFGVRLDLPTE